MVDDTLNGVFYHINVPGAGVVSLAIGRIVFDEYGEPSFISGQGLEELDAMDDAMICEGIEDH